MPNLISVTSTGPDIADPLKQAISSPVGQEIVGGVRKAGQIFKANPLGAVLTDLIFPDSFADGTMDARSRL